MFISIQKNMLLSALLMLSACATLSPDGGLNSVQQTTQERLGKEIKLIKSDSDQIALTERTHELLKAPLTADCAVQIALLNNKSLQASLYDIGISEADLVQATRLSNPRLSLRYAKNGSDFNIEQILTFNIFSLFTMPLAKEIGERQLAETKAMVTFDVLRLAANTRKAYFNAVAAEQAVAYMEQVKLAAEASNDLAHKMTEAGNFSKRDQALEQVFYAEVTAEAARTKQAEVVAREQLIRLMGLWGEQTHFTLPEHLPNLPDSLTEQTDIEATAMKQRLDIQAMQQQMAGLAKNLGLTKATRFINVLEIGPVRVLDGKRSDPYKTGVEISIELPIFDFGTAKVAKAEAIYMQAMNRAAEQAVNARSEVREAYFNYRTTYDIAKHYRDEIIPLRKLIADENILRYNGMLMSVFELLTDAQTQVTSIHKYIQSLRDFWVAESDLEMAMAGKPSIPQLNNQ
jgi:outer membrane protein TolC